MLIIIIDYNNNSIFINVIYFIRQLPNKVYLLDNCLISIFIM